MDSYVNSIDQVERITGLDFFSALPDEVENRIEKEYDLKYWRYWKGIGEISKSSETTILYFEVVVL